MDPHEPCPAEAPPNRAPAAGPQELVSDHDFRLMVDSIGDYAIFLLDPSGHVRTWNLGAERIKGYRPQEIVGQHFRVFYPPDQVARRWPDYELEMARKEGRFEDEGWRVRKDGTRFWALVVITRLLDEQGRLRGFSKVTRDLTERRMHEQMLRRSEERFRLLIEGVQDYAIFLLDPEGHVATWNPGAQRTKGYRADEILGKHVSSFYPPELAASGWADEVLSKALQNGRYEEEGWRIRKDGSRFWASVVVTPLFDEKGGHRGFAKVTRDLTDKRRIRHLEDEGRRISTFLAMLGHELRNPLAPIANSLALLRLAPPGSAAAVNAREVIERQVAQMTRLVDDLLDVGRITSGKISLERAPVQLAALVDEAVAAAGPLAAEQGLTLETTPADPALWVDADRARLLQLLGNLLSNAIKFTPAGGVIRVTLRRQPGVAELSVLDSGIGVPAHLAEDIFRPFVQGEQDVARSQGGLGLGLALVQQIAELHGGTVAVYGAHDGPGAEFVVSLPLALTPGVAPPPPRLPRRALNHSLLVVDDNVDAANTLRIVLEAIGYRVRVAFDGNAALARVREEQPDAVLLDLGLPGVSGLEVARTLRAEFPQPPKLIAVTGYGSEEDREQTGDAGFDLHLTKPVDFSELAQSLERLLA
jgi:PAS domain S-box-containing protein